MKISDTSGKFWTKERLKTGKSQGPSNRTGMLPPHVAITANRWPHGYGYEYKYSFDPDWPQVERPNAIGRRPFGRITIANTDSGATTYTDIAIEQAYRAVQQLT